MNFIEFKRRLMTDPASQDVEFRQARTASAEHAAAAAESDRFEAALKRALAVPVPQGLAEDIILRQSLADDRADGAGKGRWPRLMAVAAALALAVALITFNVADREPGPADIAEHVSWHWQHDGPLALAAARTDRHADPVEVERVFSEFGLQIEPALRKQVRLTKFCPTPDGAGAHMVLETSRGPVTIYYMPRTRIPSSPRTIGLPGDMQSLVVNLKRGSMALIAPVGADTTQLAREISSQLSFAPGVTI